MAVRNDTENQMSRTIRGLTAILTLLMTQTALTKVGCVKTVATLPMIVGVLTTLTGLLPNWRTR